MNEAELLFSEILECERAHLYLNGSNELSGEDSALVADVLKRRISGEPLQYILGKAEFFGLKFKVNKHVLIPRPETELAVEAALRQDFIKKSALRILELGTGSGCVAVSLANSLPEAEIIATDISSDALAIAEENALSYGVANRIRFTQGDLFKAPGLPALKFDIIISNPPYITSEDIDKLQTEVKFEPRIALDGGIDGLNFYRRIVKEAGYFLKDKGTLILEIGFGQADKISEIFNAVKILKIVEIARDYSGIERVIVARKAR
jgi:release factor glutamine methyltransferase